MAVGSGPPNMKVAVGVSLDYFGVDSVVVSVTIILPQVQ